MNYKMTKTTETQLELPALATRHEKAMAVDLQKMLAFDHDPVHASLKKWRDARSFGTIDGAAIVMFDDIVIVPGFNPRPKDAAYFKDVYTIARSIKENGYYQDCPMKLAAVMVGKSVQLHMFDGHTRHDAVLLARTWGCDIDSVPAIVSDSSVSREDACVALVHKNSGRPLPPFGLAIVCKRLSGWGWSTATIAEKTCVSKEYVDDLLRFIGAPQAIRNMVEAGTTTVAVALKAITTHGSEAVEVLAAAEKRVQAAGKKKITTKHLPGVALSSSLKKSAPRFFSALQEVKTDPGYSNLAGSLREKIDLLVLEMARNPGANVTNVAASAEVTSSASAA